MASSRPPGSPPLHPSSRTPSLRSQSNSQFTPTHPSGLRESYTLATSPETTRDLGEDGTDDRQDENSRENNEQSSTPAHPTRGLDTITGADDEADGQAYKSTGVGKNVDETTALLRKPLEVVGNAAHPGSCNHGTFSPRLDSRADSIMSFGASAPASPDGSGEPSDGMIGGFLRSLGARNGSIVKPKRMSTTDWLVEQHGITNTTRMYVLLRVTSLI